MYIVFPFEKHVSYSKKGKKIFVQYQRVFLNPQSVEFFFIPTPLRSCQPKRDAFGEQAKELVVGFLVVIRVCHWHYA